MTDPFFARCAAAGPPFTRRRNRGVIIDPDEPTSAGNNCVHGMNSHFRQKKRNGKRETTLRRAAHEYPRGALSCVDRRWPSLAMTAVLDLSGGPDVGLSGWLVPLRGGIRDPSLAVRLPDKPGDVLVIGRLAKPSSRRTLQRTVIVTALLLDDDRTPPQVSGDHAEIELREDGVWCLRHNSKNAGSFINEGPPLHATNGPGMGPRLLQHGDRLRFGGGIRGTASYSDRFTYIFEKEEAYTHESAPSPAGLQPDLSTAAGRQVDKASERAVIVELEKEKAAHPAIRQVVDAEQHGQAGPVGSARARCTSSGRAWRL